LIVEGDELSPEELDKLNRALAVRLSAVKNVRVEFAPVAPKNGEKSFEFLGALLIDVAINLSQHVAKAALDEIQTQISEVVRGWIRIVSHKIRVKLTLPGRNPILIPQVQSEAVSETSDTRVPLGQLASAAEESQDITPKYALLIANGTYMPNSGFSNLKCPKNDVEALAKSLLQFPNEYHEDSVIKLIDGTRNQVEEKLEEMLQKARETFLLIYYSGHGHVSPVTNELYLAAATSAAGKMAGSVKFSEIIKLVQENIARRVGIVLDCCFAGRAEIPGAPTGQIFKGPIGDHVTTVVKSSNKGIYFIGASTATQAATEGDGNLSTLTAAFVKGISHGYADKEKQRRVSFDNLYNYLCSEIGQSSHQTPVRSFTESGEPLILVRSAHPELRRRGDLTFHEELARIRGAYF
jgi:hypothetical protein